MKNLKLPATALLMVITAGIALAQERHKADRAIEPKAASGPVIGAGTPGQIVKWSGVSGSSTFSVGDSIITEDKFSNLGVGTTTPTSKFTVQGMIETNLGGYRFPDGTVQTTAALSSIFHDASLAGDGTSAFPLGIAAGGVGNIHLAPSAVTATKIANGAVVRSLNGFFENVTILPGDNISVTGGTNTLTISAPNSLSSVRHNSSLSGDGSTSAPLGISIPLFLDGSAFVNILTVRNSKDGGNALFAGGGAGGMGIDARGGDSFVFGGFAGLGLHARGGNSFEGAPGEGIHAEGGNSSIGFGGVGIRAKGGNSQGVVGGIGIRSEGGESGSTFGGIGIQTIGGLGTGSGNQGGFGIFAQGGPGQAGATMGDAAVFNGNVDVNGNLSKSGGSFKIDHPLDPENKYLYHSFVESPDMMNLYNGNIVTDSNGDAVVTLPEWFEALNKDFRYQLTVLGTFAQAIVADEIQGNHFAIKTSVPNVKVSWQVTGVRQDAYARKHRIVVEEDKPDIERGTYLHPAAFGQPEEKGVEWARHPQLMLEVKETRLKQIKN